MRGRHGQAALVLSEVLAGRTTVQDFYAVKAGEGSFTH